MGEPYVGFAEIYDLCMQSVDYQGWISYLGEILQRFDHHPASVADLGCGTGRTTLPWAERGLKTYGVDRSEPMLERARAAAAALGLEVTFLKQDIRNLNLPEPVDLVTCLYDTVNYILEPRGLLDLFAGVNRSLRPGGLMVFDINSYHKLSSVKPEAFHFEGGDYHLIWQQRYSESERLWTVDLTGFVRDSGQLYRRFQEQHLERAYRRREITELVESAGLSCLACYRAYGFAPPEPEDDRFYFVTRKEESECC